MLSVGVCSKSLFPFTKAATQTLCENPSDAQGLGGEEQKEAEEESKKDNENQQEWEKDTDLAGGSLEKPRYLSVHCSIIQNSWYLPATACFLNCRKLRMLI